MPSEISAQPAETPLLHDNRNRFQQTDDDIIASLLAEASLPTTEKNVWAYWHTGFQSMPKWTQRNVVGWVRRLDRSWTVRVLDRVPGSRFNVERFVSLEQFPRAFAENRMEGHYAATHSADLVRLPLLYLHGGIWLDVNTILIRDLADIWDDISSPSTPYELAGFASKCRPDDDSLINNFLVSRKDNAFLKRWHQIFVTVWGDASQCVDLHKHPLLRHQPLFHTAAVPLTAEEKANYEGAMMDYGAQVLCAERLRDLVDPSDGFDGRHFFQEKILFLPMFEEMFLYQKLTDCDGNLQSEYLATQCDAQGANATSARAFVEELLQNTTMLKFCHGPKGVHLKSLAHIWDDPSHDGADIAPGTLAEFLRNGAVTRTQARVLQPVKPLIPPQALVRQQGVLEPFL